MSKKLENIQLQFQKRNARAQGPTSSKSYNDSIDELAYDLSSFRTQWNNRLVKLTSVIPDGTGSNTDLNAFTDGLDGRTLLVHSAATASSNTAYYNTSKSRPNSMFEQMQSIYSSMDTLREDLENEIGNSVYTASDISVKDAGSLYLSSNVEDALAEIGAKVDNLSGIGSGSVEEVAFFTSTGTVQGDSNFSWNATSQQLQIVGSLRASQKLEFGEQASAPSTVAGYGVLYTLSSDQALYWRNGAGTIQALGTLSGLNDTTLTTVASGQVLKYNGSAWVNASDVGVTDHTALSNIGTNTHAQIDTHISSAAITGSGVATQISCFTAGRVISGVSPMTYNVGTGVIQISDSGTLSPLGAGTNSVKIGAGTPSATGTGSVAIGKDAAITNQQSIGIGPDVTVPSRGAVVIGNGAYDTSTGYTSNTIIGDSTYNNDGANTSSVIIGDGAGLDAPGAGTAKSQVVIGYFAWTDSDRAICIGENSYASSASFGIAIGQPGAANAAHAIAIGNGADVGYMDGIAIGRSSLVNTLAPSGIAMGYDATVKADYGIAIGANTTVDTNHDYSIALGVGTTTTAASGIFIGNATYPLDIWGSNTLALRETTAPSNTAGYGKLYVKSSDSKLYFLDDSGAEFDLTASGVGSGDVTKVGTPVNDQIGIWTGDGTIEGDANLQFDVGNILKVNGQMAIGDSIFSATAGYSIHVKNNGDSAIWLAADADDVGTDECAWIRFTQDGTLVDALIGCSANGTEAPDGVTVSGLFDDALLIKHNKTGSTGVIQFATDDTLAMTINSSQDVGIGLNNPSEKLEVAGNVKISGQISQTSITTETPAGTTQTIDWDNGNVAILDLASASGDVTLTLSNPAVGASYILKIIQDATTPRNVVWPATVKWQGGTTPTISTGATAVDVVTLLWDGTNYYANIGQDYQ